jgi:hypothetical protein
MVTEDIRPYVIVHEASNRIVAKLRGRHAWMNREIDVLEARFGEGRFFYDDADNAGAYLPQIGPSWLLSLR